MVSLTKSKSSKSLHKGKKGHKHTPLFDIRLSSTERDVIVLKGPPDEAAPVLVTGVVVLSVTEPITVKKLSLSFSATLNMHWEEKFQNGKGNIFTRPFNYDRVIFNYEWDPLNLHDFLDKASSGLGPSPFSVGSSPNLRGLAEAANGQNGSGTGLSSGNGSYGSLTGFVTGHQTGSNSSSSSSLVSISKAVSQLQLANSPSSTAVRKNKSSSSLAGLSFHVEPTVLPAGNYEFPFQTLVQGSIPESIDGLSGCSLVYRLQSVLERGRFSTPIITRRLVHVVRTLQADSSELSETVAVDNTWPGKVDYSISVPTRAMAVGSSCNIEIIMVPLSKGLRLGPVRIKLAEYSSLVCPVGSRSQERHIISKTIPKITTDSGGKDIWTETEIDGDGVFYHSKEVILTQDRWNVQTKLTIPASLAHITQDCDIRQSVKVRHKLKFSIGLINPDGHVSELRATLPISIFVSPFVPVRARSLRDFDSSQALSGYEDATMYTPGSEVLFALDAGSETLLQQGSRSGDATPVGSSPGRPLTRNSSPERTGSEGIDALTLSSVAPTSVTPSPAISTSGTPAGSSSNLNLNTQDLMAPPSYEHHVFDRLFDANSDDVTQGLNMVPADRSSTSQLMANLSRQSTSGNISSSAPVTRTPRPVFTMSGDESGMSAVLSASHVISGPAFEGGTVQFAGSGSSSGANLSALVSPAANTPVQHLSRVTSLTADDPSRTPQDGAPEEDHWNTRELSRVPSYDTAVKLDLVAEDLTPAYEPQEYEARINLELLDSRLEDVHSTHVVPQSGNSALAALHSPKLMATSHSISPKFGSSTSLFSKQLHKLQRMSSYPIPTVGASNNNKDAKTGSAEGLSTSPYPTSDSTGGSTRPPVTPLGGKQSKSSVSFKLFHRN
ncbi:DEKNAAC102208 [Brettanomyces naardenensis]|uniref:DEKNAAC102208 n=1 Tax=Brettanomyces naardenensis TaxID=13370 RepID=A0A448YL09_BRENA|nr:DEKNAAC102208 [Brettanomyces naardenensis]